MPGLIKLLNIASHERQPYDIISSLQTIGSAFRYNSYLLSV